MTRNRHSVPIKSARPVRKSSINVGRADSMTIRFCLNNDESESGVPSRSPSYTNCNQQTYDAHCQTQFAGTYPPHWDSSPLRDVQRECRSQTFRHLPSHHEVPAPRRPGRPKYTNAQNMFIWYHRVDVKLDWNQVAKLFIRQFHQIRTPGGLQCRYYRILEEQKVPAIRKQVRRRHISGDLEDKIEAKYGVIDWTAHRYEWMLPKHQLRAPTRRLG